MTLPYVPELEPFADFAIVLGFDIKQRTTLHEWTKKAGVHRCTLPVPQGDSVEYAPILVSSVPATLDCPIRLFSGLAFETELITTPPQAERALRRRGKLNLHGNYACVRVDAEGDVIVESDAFGMSPLYTYRSGRMSVISNRLHLLLTIVRALGWHLSRNAQAFMSRMYPFSFGQQLSSEVVYFDEVRLVRNGMCCRVRAGQVTTHRVPEETFSSYEDAITCARDEMLNQVQLLATRHPVYYRLSGGWDSRAVFGAIVRLGLQASAAKCWTFPHIKDDFAVVCGLIRAFGGTFSISPIWQNGTVAQELSEAFTRFRSRQMGCYSTDLGFETHRRRGFGSDTLLVLFGGGGECFRDFYFSSLQDGATPKEVESLLEGSIRRHQNLARFAKDLASIFRDNLLSIPGEGVLDSLRLHYMNFRNRFHFGHNTQSVCNRINVHPLMQASLLEACRLAGRQAVARGQIHFDLQASFLPILPLMPFDKPEKSFPSDVVERSPFYPYSSKFELALDKDPSVYQPVELPVQNDPVRFTPAARRNVWLKAVQEGFERMAAYPPLAPFCTDEFRKYVLGLDEKGSFYKQWTGAIIGTGDLLAV